MGLLDKIKADVKKSGQNRGKFIYFREGVKQRIRFLNDMDDGMEVTFHDSYTLGVNVPCQEHFGRSCEYCDEEELRTRSQYVWSVYNYDTKEVQLFMFPVNNCSPVPALVAMYEQYGTLTDRDFVISVSGKRADKTYSVVPMDKQKFRNAKAKPYSEAAILKMIDKAYPADDAEDEDDAKPVKKRNTKPVKDEANDADDGAEGKYDDLAPKELYKLCKERDIEVEAKKPAKYYINALEEYDEAQDDWGDNDDEDDDWDGDEWEEE